MKVGDFVKVCEYEGRGFLEPMRAYVGRTARIIDTDEDEHGRYVRLALGDRDGDQWWWYFDYLVAADEKKADPVEHPPHYTSHPSGVECITVVEHMPFCRGNAIKYLWRAGEKDDEIQDLEKARWYVDREIARVKALRVKAAEDRRFDQRAGGAKP